MKLLKFVSFLCTACVAFSYISMTVFTASAVSAASVTSELELVSPKLFGNGVENRTEIITGADVSALPYVRVTYKSNVTAAHELILSAGGAELVVCDDISRSGGRTVRSESVFVPENIRKQLSAGGTASIRCTATAEGCDIEVTEVRFFATDKQAYEYYGEKRTVPYVPNKITFGKGGNAAFYSKDLKYGNHVYEESTDSLKIVRDIEGNYRTMVKLVNVKKWRENDCYVRIVYSADTKSGNVPLKLRNNGTGEIVTFGNVQKTSDFVLSDTVKLPDSMVERYSSGIHNTFIFEDHADGSTYRIKEILFFPDEETAASYRLTKGGSVGISVLGEDISKYRFVIPKSAGVAESTAVQELSRVISQKCGVTIPTVNDSTAPQPYEIIVGDCNRAECSSATLGPNYSYRVSAVGKKIVISGIKGSDVSEAVSALGRIYFESGKISDGNISVGSDIYLSAKNNIEFADLDHEASDEPINVNYSFNDASDVQKFSASNGTAVYRNGSMRITGDGLTIAESPLYDSDMSIEFAFSYSDTGDGARVGAMLRQSNDGSYVAVCYDVDAGKLRILVKPSMVMEEHTVAECEASLLMGHLYRMKAELVGDSITVSLWGNEILSSDGIFMNAPGKAAFFSEDAALEVCELDASLLTTAGRILGDALFNETVIMEAGGDSNYRIPSMICTNDGTLIAAANDRRYTVADAAQEQWLVYRRKPVDGDWEEIKVLAAKEKTSYGIGNAIYDDVNDVIIILYSTFGAFSYDDGVTWEIKEITRIPNSHGKVGGTHGASAGFVLKHGEHAGRIISPARYSIVGGESRENLQTNHYNCAIYSDDGGLTWQTSEPVQVGTGEGTLIEREDGVIVYSSRAYFYDHYRRVAYSYDSGETFADFRLDSELLEPYHGVNASMLRAEMKNGQVITLFSNPYPIDKMIGTQTRKNMTVSLSYNEAGSWAMRKTVYSGFSAYSSLAYNPVTDTFFLMYEGDDDGNGYGYIAVAEFNLEWILE